MSPWVSTFPDPRLKVGGRKLGCKCLVLVPVLELEDEARLRSHSTIPSRAQGRLRLRSGGCGCNSSSSAKGFCNLPAAQVVVVYLPCRNSNQLSFVQDVEENSWSPSSMKTTVKSSPGFSSRVVKLTSFTASVLWDLNGFHGAWPSQPPAQFCYPNNTGALFACVPPDNQPCSS